MPEPLGSLPTLTSTDESTFIPITDGVDSSKISIANLRKVLQPYSFYSVKISQSEGNAPTVVENQNLLGGSVVYSYVGVGIYRGVLTAAFSTAQKFVAFPTLGKAITNIITVKWIDVDTFEIRTYDAGVLANNALLSTALEIKVYY